MLTNKPSLSLLKHKAKQLLMTGLATVPFLVVHPMSAHAAAHSLKVLIYGGTGMIGQRIVSEALSRGDTVTIVVRDSSTVTDKRDHLTVVQGNVLNAGDLAKQIAGQDVVIEAVSSRVAPPPAGTPPAGPGSPPPPAQQAHFYKSVAEGLVGAARQLGSKAPRLLFVGGAASLKDTNGKLLLDEIPGVPVTSDLYTTKEALDYLRTVKDVRWTVLSPAQQIAPGVRTGKFRLGKNTIVKDAKGTSSISAEDFAVAMIDEAHTPAHIRQRFTLGY